MGKKLFNVLIPKQVRHLRQGEGGFVEIVDVYFDDKTFAIPWDARVYKEGSETRFYIKRVGSTFKARDFVIDLSPVNHILWFPASLVAMMWVYQHPELFLRMKDVDIHSSYEWSDDEIAQYPEDEQSAIRSLKEEDWRNVFPPTEITSLKKQLEEAIEEENYKKAAQLRDLIKKMERGEKDNKQGD